MLVRLAGPASAVGAAAGQIESEVLPGDNDFWYGLREMSLPFFADASDLWCISLRSTHEHFLHDAEWMLDWRGARRWVAASDGAEALDGTGGEVWHARGAADGAEVFPERSEAYRRTLLRLKLALDPSGIFNPGRLYSWM